jgi:hypothetical protein
MDLSDALFSPSKARQQQAQAKDWVFVDSWLSKKYHPKGVPAFERNEETLQSLMTLVAFNERADEEQNLVEKVEREAYRELEEKVGYVMFIFHLQYRRMHHVLIGYQKNWDIIGNLLPFGNRSMVGDPLPLSK